jgi:hypothetical protein
MLKQVQHDGFNCQGHEKQVGLPAGSPEPGWPGLKQVQHDKKEIATLASPPRNDK